MMGLIGFCVGMLGFLLHQIIDLISEVKWEQTKEYIAQGEFSTALMWTFSYSLVFLVVSTLLVVYQPAAAGSGIPEIIGFLNGTRIPDIFKVHCSCNTTAAAQQQPSWSSAEQTKVSTKWYTSHFQLGY